jgi:hypothetical protein
LPGANEEYDNKSQKSKFLGSGSNLGPPEESQVPISTLQYLISDSSQHGSDSQLLPSIYTHLIALLLQQPYNLVTNIIHFIPEILETPSAHA